MQKGFASILLIVVLVAVVLLGGGYLVYQKQIAPSPIPTSPKEISCQSDLECPAGYRCQIQASTQRECPENEPNCNAVIGTCEPREESYPRSCKSDADCKTGEICTRQLGWHPEPGEDVTGGPPMVCLSKQ